jgi:hypothetical protein
MSVFDGTWRPDYDPSDSQEAPDVLELSGGTYHCHSCDPPFSVPADGQDHVVQGHPKFDTIAITVLDDWSIRKVGHRGAAVVFESTTVVAADGQTTTEEYTAVMKVGEDVVPITAPLMPGTGSAARPVLFGVTARRVGSAMPGAHLLSGRWKVLERDLVNHDEDTTYLVADGSLKMVDALGRSFRAKLDGTMAPYRGDPRFTGVSVRLIDDRTIEESDLSRETVVQVTRWSVDPDGTTMHVRFDDTRGHVMEQTGHKVVSQGSRTT